MAMEFASVVKKFGNLTVLKGLSLSIGRGELVAYLGPNGAGKTTTIRLALGLLKPDGGSIKVLGVDVVSNPQDVKGLVGYVSQNPLAEVGRVDKLIYLHARLFGISKSEALEKAKRFLRDLGLEHLLDKRVENLSFGQRRVVQVVRELVHDPQLLLLDEPIAGLDPLMRRKLLELVYSWARENDATIFMASHILQDVELLCKRVLILMDGKVAFDGSIENVRDLLRKFVKVVALLDRDINKPLVRGNIRIIRNLAVAIAPRNSVYQVLQEIERASESLGRSVASVSVGELDLNDLVVMILEGKAGYLLS